MTVHDDFQTAPAQSFVLNRGQLDAITYTFEKYEYLPAPKCSRDITCEIGGSFDASWMELDYVSGPNPLFKLQLDQSGIEVQQDINLEFQVMEVDAGAFLVQEPFTLTVADCRTVSGSQLSFENGLPFSDATGSIKSSYVWSLSESMTHVLTIENVMHNDAICGQANLSITADDADFTNYATVDTANEVINFDFNLRSTQPVDDLI